MFFLFILCCFQNNSIIPVDTENPKQKLAIATPAGGQITAANDTIDRYATACCR